MKRTLTLVLLHWVLFTNALDSTGNKLISYSIWKTVSRDEFAKTLKDKKVPKSMVHATTDVDIYEIRYKTCWYDGACIMASGLYFVPHDRPKPLAEAVLHHGTRLQTGRGNKLGGQEFLCTGMAMDGYAVLYPDYVGLGFGEKFHLYLNAQTEGQATVDMLYAIKELNDTLGIKLSGQLFLTGYSQGGHACMAATKLIQEKYSNDFKVTASAPLSGPYDLTGAQEKVMFQKYSQSWYLPYMLLGLNEVYHIMPDINQAYRSPYDTIIPKLFNGQKDYGALKGLLPDTPYLMLKDTFIQLYLTNPDFIMRKALKDNSLIDWKPEMPIMMCYCSADEQVKPENAKEAKASFKAHGAKHIRTVNAGRKYGHTKCALFAAMYAKLYFDSFRNGSKYGRRGNVNSRFMMALAKLAIKP